MANHIEVLLNGVSLGLSNWFSAQVIERRPGHPKEGQVVFETAPAPNLILDTGFDRIAVDLIPNLFTVCVVGTSNNPVERTSGEVLATTSGDVLSLTNPPPDGFFVAGDVGRLLRFTGGPKARITQVLNPNQVQLSAGLDVSTPTAFRIFYTTDSALGAEVRRSNTYLPGAGNSETTYSSDLVTHRRTYDFPVESAPITYREVGFSNSTTSGATIFTRGLFPEPVSLVAGQQLRVVYNFRVRVGPVVGVRKEAPISGWPAKKYFPSIDPDQDAIILTSHGFPPGTEIRFTGTTPPGGLQFGQKYYVLARDANSFRVSSTPGGTPIDITSTGEDVILLTNVWGVERLQRYELAYISTSNGNTLGGGAPFISRVNEPGVGFKEFVLSTHSSFPPFGADSGFLYGDYAEKLLSAESYVSGSGVKIFRVTFSTTEGNFVNIRKIFTKDIEVDSRVGLVFLFDMPQEKANTHTLTVRVRYAWDREIYD